MARAKKAAAAAPVAVAADAAKGAPANAGAPAQPAAGDPGNDPAQAATPASEATQVVEVPGAAPAVVVSAEIGTETLKVEEAQAGDAEAVFNDTDLLATYEAEKISVTSRKSRWRAGRQFGPDAVTIDTDELSDDDLLSILKDPQLEVSIVA